MSEAGRIRLDTLAQLAADAWESDSSGWWEPDELETALEGLDGIHGATGEHADAAYIAAFSPDIGAALVRAVQVALEYVDVDGGRDAWKTLHDALEPFRETA